MGKPSTPRRLQDNQVSATARFIRVPPRKARLVMDAVRGKYVSDALATLKFVPNFAARAIDKVIRSAVANAENGRPFDSQGRAMAPLNTDNLKLVRGYVDEGPRLKRIQPRAQGRAYRILKRMCHISVVLEEAEPKPQKPRRTTAARRARAAGRTAGGGRPHTRAAEAASAAKAVVEEPVAPTPVQEAPAETAPVQTEAPADEAGTSSSDQTEQAG